MKKMMFLAASVLTATVSLAQAEEVLQQTTEQSEKTQVGGQAVEQTKTTDVKVQNSPDGSKATDVKVNESVTQSTESPNKATVTKKTVKKKSSHRRVKKH